jgi:hypothetical protein
MSQTADLRRVYCKIGGRMAVVTGRSTWRHRPLPGGSVVSVHERRLVTLIPCKSCVPPSSRLVQQTVFWARPKVREADHAARC